METLLHLKDAIWHNCIYVVESATAWILVAFAHIVSLSVEHPPIIDILPYIQLISLLMACVASGYTIYKIRRDLKKKK